MQTFTPDTRALMSLTLRIYVLAEMSQKGCPTGFHTLTPGAEYTTAATHEFHTTRTGKQRHGGGNPPDSIQYMLARRIISVSSRATTGLRPSHSSAFHSCWSRVRLKLRAGHHMRASTARLHSAAPYADDDGRPYI